MDPLKVESGPTRPGPPWLFWLALSAVWIGSAAWLGHHLMRGWVPHDEGSLGLSAMRLLDGQLPHRDFDEIYTGGLVWLNALGFQILGVSLHSIRVLHFLFFLGFVPALYYVVTRFVSPLPAAGLTALASTWSTPNYAAAMPSWHNLYFAVFGTAAMLRFLETRARRWLVVAGACGGLSFLAKMPGLYFIAAGLLFLIHLEQTSTDLMAAAPTRRGRLYPLFVTTGLISFVALLGAMVRSHPQPVEFLHFILPGAGVVGWLVAREWSGRGGTDAARFRELFGLTWPFVGGASLPVAIFLMPYAASRSLASFYRGVFVLPVKRLDFTFHPPPPLAGTLTAVALLALVALALRLGSRGRTIVAAVASCVFASLLALSGKNAALYQLSFWAAATSIPVLVMAGLALLHLRVRPPLRVQQVFLVLTVAAVCSLLQYPSSAPVYFCFVAALGVIAAVAIASLLERPPGLLLAAMGAFFLAFAVVRVTPGFVYSMGRSYLPDEQTARLVPAVAGGMWVYAEDAQEYNRAAALVGAHASGEYIYAGPDCPEIYFLTGNRNPTRTLFDFFDERKGRAERILAAIDAHAVRVVAINRSPEFSGPLEPELRQALEARFSNREQAGRFEVRWR